MLSISYKLIHEDILQTISHEYLHIKRNHDRSILIIAMKIFKNVPLKFIFPKVKMLLKEII